MYEPENPYSYDNVQTGTRSGNPSAYDNIQTGTRPASPDSPAGRAPEFVHRTAAERLGKSSGDFSGGARSLADSAGRRASAYGTGKTADYSSAARSLADSSGRSAGEYAARRTYADRSNGADRARAAVNPTSAQARNYHENDALANSRSNYRRTSARYTTKGRRFKKILLGALIVLGILVVLVGAALGIARWAGLFKFAGETSPEDTTLISLHNKGKEALLPAINVDTLIAGIDNVKADPENLLVFNTASNKDFKISDESRAALSRAIANAEALLHHATAEAEDPETAKLITAAENTEEPSEGEEGKEGEETAALVEEDEPASIPVDNISQLVINLEDGQGVAYNVDGYVHGAGAIKALYATYFASQFLDTAKASVESEGAQMERALRTDGDAVYETLRRAYDSAGWDAWVGGIGAKSYVSSAGYYPISNARMQAKAWLNVYRYLTGSTAYAAWLSEQLETDNTSLIVKALSTTRVIEIPVFDEEGNPVMTKATKDQPSVQETETVTLSPLGTEMVIWAYGGQETNGATDSYCIVENAIVLVNGKSYLFCVMAGLPPNQTNKDLVIDILSSAAHAVIEMPASPEPAAEPEPDQGPETA